MLQRILAVFPGVKVDARAVALVRGIILAIVLAAVVGLEKALLDPDLSGYGWVPVAVMILRLIEGALDHEDNTRPG